MGSDPPLTPEQIQAQTFTSSFRGFDQAEVRSFLHRVAGDLRSLLERAHQLESAWHSAEERAARPPVLDEDTLMAAVGDETAAILRTARAAAADLRAKAAAEAEKVEATARERSEKALQESGDIVAREAAAAQENAARVVAAAQAEAAEVLERARVAVDGIRGKAEQERALTIEGANSTRDRILEDLARRRRVATVQIEQLRAGRERLIESYAIVRRTLEEAQSELGRADAEARAAADEVGRRLRREHEVGQYGHSPSGGLMVEEGVGEEPTVDGLLAGPAPEEHGPGEPSPGEQPSEEAGQLEAPAHPAEPTGAADPGAATPGGATSFAPQGPTAGGTAPSGSPGAGTAPSGSSGAGIAPSGSPGPAAAAGVGTSATSAASAPAASAASAAAAPAAAASVAVAEAVTRTGESPSHLRLVSDQPAVEDLEDLEDPGSPVDELFARIRSGRPATPDPEAGTEDEAATPVPGPGEDTRPDEDTGQYAETDDDERPVPDLDESLLQRRESAVVDLEVTLTRRLKRALQDEQNDLLDRLRSLRGKVSVDRLLPESGPQIARYTTAAQPLLEEASAAGAAFAAETLGRPESDAREGSGPHGVDDLAHEAGQTIVDALRRRLEEVCAASPALSSGDDEDRAVVMSSIGSAYREWKSQRIERIAGDALAAAFSRGTWHATPDGTLLRWIVEDTDGPCPDCDDDALAGGLRKGEPFPTGQLHPPAHTGCRCLLVPLEN
jgi:DivIVA domain-containing protein